MGSGELYADTGLVFRNDRIIESGNVYAFFLHFGSEILREFRIIEHHGADRALCGLDVKSGLDHAGTEILYILHQMRMEVVALAKHAEHLDARAHDRGCHRIREQVGTRTLAQHVDNLLASGGEAAHCAAERLAEGTGEYVDLTVAVELLGHTVTCLSDNSCRMALVDHYQRVILFRQLTDSVHRSHIAVHRENAVGGDDAETAVLGLLKAAFEIIHVGILVAETLRLAETDTVDDGGVVERIADDCILLSEKRLEQTAVGIEACRVKNCVLSLEIITDRLLEFLVKILCAADEAH